MTIPWFFSRSLAEIVMLQLYFFLIFCGKGRSILSSASSSRSLIRSNDQSDERPLKPLALYIVRGLPLQARTRVYKRACGVVLVLMSAQVPFASIMEGFVSISVDVVAFNISIITAPEDRARSGYTLGQETEHSDLRTRSTADKHLAASTPPLSQALTASVSQNSVFCLGQTYETDLRRSQCL